MMVNASFSTLVVFATLAVSSLATPIGISRDAQSLERRVRTELDPEPKYPKQRHQNADPDSGNSQKKEQREKEKKHKQFVAKTKANGRYDSEDEADEAERRAKAAKKAEAKRLARAHKDAAPKAAKH